MVPTYRTYLVRTAVLHNLGTQVATFDGSQVLLVRLPVTVVLVQHVWGTSFCLGLNDGVPQLLGFDGFPPFAFLFISVKCVTEINQNQTPPTISDPFPIQLFT
jgi:hypothetical protein